MDIKQLDKKYIAPTYVRHDINLVSGCGSELFDDTGKRYIDLGSGIAVNTFGTADPVWADAVCAQARALQHTSNYFYTAPQAELAALICERTGMSSVFFCNSGAEANECAIKAARKYANDRYHGDRPIIVTLQRSFHGRTLAALYATGQEQLHDGFGPDMPGFTHAARNDVRAMEALLNNGDICAIMLELVQGEGGVNALDNGYVKAVADMTKSKDILLIIDEVQTGNGRTGTLYAYEQFGIQPDIVTTAKGLAGGLPFGAVMFNETTSGVLTAGTHGSTFGGNPVCTAAALSTLKRIDSQLLKEVTEKAAYIRSELEGAPGVMDVTGLGLMIGIETARPAIDIQKACLSRGVIVLTAKTKVRLLPPLNIPIDLLREAVGVLKDELKK